MKSSKKTARGPVSVVIAILTICLVALFGFLAYSSYKRADSARYIYNKYNMGEAYIEWQQALNHIAFEDSKDLWNEVQKDWEEQGVKVSWEYVCRVYEESVEKGIPFHTHFRGSFNEDFYSGSKTASEVYFVLSIVCIPATYYALNPRKLKEHFVAFLEGAGSKKTSKDDARTQDPVAAAIQQEIKAEIEAQCKTCRKYRACPYGKKGARNCRLYESMYRR